MYSRPTTTQLNLSRRFTFVSDSYYSFTSYISRNALKLQALSPHVHSRPTQSAKLVETFLFVSFFSFLYLHLQECLEAPGPVTACAFQTNLNRTNLSRRLSFVCFLLLKTFLATSSGTLTESYYVLTHYTPQRSLAICTVTVLTDSAILYRLNLPQNT